MTIESQVKTITENLSKIQTSQKFKKKLENQKIHLYDNLNLNESIKLTESEANFDSEYFKNLD